MIDTLLVFNTENATIYFNNILKIHDPLIAFEPNKNCINIPTKISLLKHNKRRIIQNNETMHERRFKQRIKNTLL